MSITNTREFELPFSLNKQTDIQTAISAAKVNQKLPYRTFAPSTTEFPDRVSDRQWYGKGHSHPTFWDPVTRRIALANREYSMTQLSGLWAPAFVLGSLATTQPDTATAPTVYDHALTFQGPESNKECLYTSLIEEAGAEYQNLISGAVVNSFNVRGDRDDHVVIGWEGFAREQAADATVLPALAASQSFFKILNATFSFGTSGGPSVISTETLNFNLAVSQNAQALYLPGSPAGEENLIAKVLIGDQTVSGQLRAFLDVTRRNLFLNNTECEITVTLSGDTITGAYKHQVTINVPHFKISAESFEEEGQTAAYVFTFDEESVLKGTEAFITWTVRTNIDGTDLLVVNP